MGSGGGRRGVLREGGGARREGTLGAAEEVRAAGLGSARGGWTRFRSGWRVALVGAWVGENCPAGEGAGRAVLPGTEPG